MSYVINKLIISNMNIKYKQAQWDDNGKVVKLNVIGFMKLKNQKSKLIEYTDKVRIVTEPLPGFSGATTITISDNKEVQVGRIYDKTLHKLLTGEVDGEFIDSNRKKWIKVDKFDFDSAITYIEENPYR